MVLGEGVKWCFHFLFRFLFFDFFFYFPIHLDFSDLCNLSLLSFLLLLIKAELIGCFKHSVEIKVKMLSNKNRVAFRLLFELFGQSAGLKIDQFFLVVIC